MNTEQEKVDNCEKRGRERTKLVLTLSFPYVDYSFYWTTGNNTTDLWMTGRTAKSLRTYVGDVKAYLDEKHPRDLFQYPNYMADYMKLREIVKKAMNDKDKNRIPILIAVFPTYLAIWNLYEVDWEHTAEWRYVNKTGVNYGEKEWELMAYLKPEDAMIINYDESALKN